MSHLLLISLSWICLAQTDAAAASTPAPAWLTESRLGLMVYWGPYSVPARARPGERAERIMENERISIADYEGFASRLDGSKFDASVLARWAKRLNADRLVFVAKLDDGFCLWNSAVEPFNCAKFSAFRRDAVAEVGKACQTEKLRFGVAYSLADWRHSEYHLDPAKYARHALTQIGELFGQNSVDGIWLLGDLESDEKGAWNRSDFLKNLRQIKKNAIVVDHGQRPSSSNDEVANGRSYENERPEIDPFAVNPDTRPWENRLSFGDSAGWNSRGEPLQSANRMIHQIIETVAQGGSPTIQIGLKADGSVPEPLAQRLEDVASWMQVHQEAIQGVFTPSAHLFEDNDATPFHVAIKGNVIYLFLKTKTQDAITLTGLKTKIKSAQQLDKKTPLIVTMPDPDAFPQIQAPKDFPNIGPAVIKVELDGPPSF